MTKVEAIQAMMQGKKVTHKYFADGEWVTVVNPGEIQDEAGNRLGWIAFWQSRDYEAWEDGYELVESEKILSDKIKLEIKACFENTVLCARSHSSQEAYQYAEKMANHIIKFIEENE